MAIASDLRHGWCALGQAALHGSLRGADVDGLPGADFAASFVETAFEIAEADSP